MIIHAKAFSVQAMSVIIISNNVIMLLMREIGNFVGDFYELYFNLNTVDHLHLLISKSQAMAGKYELIRIPEWSIVGILPG